MKILVVTVAGKATRFNKELNRPVLKCLYTDNKYQNSILSRLINQGKSCDKIIIVGGYLFHELEEYIYQYPNIEKEKLELVFNPYFEEKGSMYSLYLGMERAEYFSPDEVIFAEGDLIVDNNSFQKILESTQDVITINSEIIWAEKSVVAYLDLQNRINYLYDINHNYLTFNGGVKAIFNSGQIWKFSQTRRIFKLNKDLKEIDKEKTNLILIQQYFNDLKFEEIEYIQCEKWFNCNTINDFVIGMKSIS